jgi:hypothetical protein
MEDIHRTYLTKTSANGSGEGASRPSGPLLSPAIPRDRRRVMELHEHVVGPDVHNRVAWIPSLECSEAAIRRRKKTGVCRNRDTVILKLGSTPQLVDNAEENVWRAHIESLPFQQPPKPKTEQSPSTMGTPDLIENIRSIEPESNLVMVSAETLDLISGADFRSAVRYAVGRRVKVLYIIHRHCRAKAELLRFAASLYGSVRIMLVENLGELMEFSEQLMVVTKPGVQITAETLEELEAGNIVRAFRQSFRGGDQLPPDDQTPTPGRPLWERLSYRHINRLPEMLRQRALGAEWLGTSIPQPSTGPFVIGQRPKNVPPRPQG